MNRRRVLALLGTVGSGGCLRLSEAGGTATTDVRSTTARTTARSTPTATATETEPKETTTEGDPEPSYPKGLSEDGVGEYLYPFHKGTLMATSFHAEWSKFSRDQSDFKWRRRYDFDAGQALGRVVTRPVGAPVDVYRNRADGCVWREDLGTGYSYGWHRDGADVEKAMWELEIQPIVRAGDWSAPERVNDRRPAVWEVTTDSVADPSAVIGPSYGAGETVALSGRLRVDERGFLREVEATHSIRRTETRGGGVREYETTFSVDSVGEVTVSEPAWLATAREKRPVVTASLVDNERYVKLSLTAGNPLEANSVIFVRDEKSGGSYNLRTSEPMSSGETVYLYRAEPDASTELRLSRGEKPPTPPSRDLSNAASLHARRSRLIAFEVDL